MKSSTKPYVERDVRKGEVAALGSRNLCTGGAGLLLLPACDKRGFSPTAVTTECIKRGRLKLCSGATEVAMMASSRVLNPGKSLDLGMITQHSRG
jgi:hypothetical protein